ncbi:carboxylating nicotinate-nucleotide diphosphorylase [Cytobacillus spongiae]|uniref:carboxylating nicotinate-nucleotide diphosphorylase n=1 Tax=Cytobacillus spongiae TaxID=2901381 RepID=UPI001F3BEFCC|nr:carboxylating nicotinate-nucleotide diphosphorylase [Cytobacillus spongiae]UII55023.1 carboxylating nicotinate-nucleotide diphosphorylase [Cytobacillus spongiae]
MNKLKLRLQLEQFFIEDIGERDVTSELIFGEKERGEIVFIAKEAGVFSGEEVIRTGFRVLDEDSDVVLYVHDGEIVSRGQQLAKVTGHIANLLKGERVVLNLVQRMSGIATITNEAVRKLGDSIVKIVDTRKTTPGLRMLEKYAVRCGGGYNHRFGLYDAVMIKDNHISFAGSIEAAVAKVKAELGHMVKVEVEVETKEQMFEAIKANVDVIMFDNRKPTEINEWLPFVPEGFTTEASGGITLENIHEYGLTGVDCISLGFLTHSAKALDISVKVFNEKLKGL